VFIWVSFVMYRPLLYAYRVVLGTCRSFLYVRRILWCIYGFLLYLFRVLCVGRGLFLIYTGSFCVHVRLCCMNTAFLLCICGSMFFGVCIDLF